jgi:hypothetical protein
MDSFTFPPATDSIWTRKKLEIEAKLGSFGDNDKFLSGVNNIHFNRLKKALKNSTDYVEKELKNSTVSFYPKYTRKIVYDNKKVKWQQKTNLYNYDSSNDGVRLSINEENPTAATNGRPNYTRTRSRISFLSKDNNYRIDLTIVLGTSVNNRVFKTHEVEIEYRGKNYAFAKTDIHKKATEISNLMYGTYHYYNQKMLLDFKKDVSYYLHLNGDIKKSDVVDARNIKKTDIVYGGLINTEKSKNYYKSEVMAINVAPKQTYSRYGVTTKADGLRKLMVINEEGIWIYFSPFEYNLVISPLPKEIYDFVGIVFDGEHIVGDNRDNSMYLIFDLIAFQENTVIQLYTYEKRVSYTKYILSKIENFFYDFKIEIKPTYIIENETDLWYYTNKLLDEKHSYEIDGLMFIPMDTIYYINNYINNANVKPSERILSKIPDVCKWKDPKNITIDFAVYRTQSGPLLMLYSEKDGKLIPFTGRRTNPFSSSTMLDRTSPLLNDIEHNTVVEFEWINNKMVARKIRSDKLGPNKLTTALSNWDDLKNPITEADIRGKSLSFSYHFLNQVKRSMYEAIENPEKANILDTGSGKGGDVSKWTKFNSIVALEPNEVHIAELESRLENTPIEKKVEIIQAGGEDVAFISESIASIKENLHFKSITDVTLMLSLSFFYSSVYMLDALINTIVENLEVGGSIHILTIDGYSMVEKMNRDGIDHSFTILNSTVKFYNRISENYGTPVDFILPNSIVGNQREYLVYLDILTAKLKTFGFTEKSFTICDSSPSKRIPNPIILSPENKEFVGLYSSIVYKNTDKKKYAAIKGDLEKTKGNYIYAGPNEYTEKQPIVLNTTPLQFSVYQWPNHFWWDYCNTGTVPTRFIIDPKNIPKECNKIKTKDKEEVMSEARTDTLPMLRLGEEKEYDDTYAPIKNTINENMYRIATLGGGNCFFHCVLKAVYPSYQNANYDDRVTITEEFRRDLAMTLELPHPDYKGFLYWDIVGGGLFPRSLMLGIADPTSISKGDFIDFSLNGLKYYLNSHEEVGEEVYDFVSEILNLDIYILRGKKDNVFVHRHTHRPGVNVPGIIILGNEYHYELVGTKKGENKFQTVFMPGDPFLVKIQSLYKGNMEIIQNAKQKRFRPVDVFYEDCSDILWVNKNNIPTVEAIQKLLPENDPFVPRYKHALEFFL